MLKRIAIGFCVILALLLGGSVWLFQDVLGPGPAPRETADTEPISPEPEPRSTAPPVASQATPAPPPVREPIVTKTRVPNSDQFVVRVTEREANDFLRSKPEIREALVQAKVSDLRIRFEPGQLVADARVPVWGRFKARVSAAGRVWAQDGNLAFETRSVRAGSLPAPGAVREELNAQISAALTRLNRERPGRFAEVQVREGVMEIRGTD